MKLMQAHSAPSFALHEAKKKAIQPNTLAKLTSGHQHASASSSASAWRRTPAPCLRAKKNRRQRERSRKAARKLMHVDSPATKRNNQANFQLPRE
eukprot:41672-Pelagomonas_calceolata.AAC.1